jgi:butanol dehydrogenase
MLDFSYFAPTKIFFGKDQLKMLGEQIKPFGKEILLVYGKGSIKKNSIYDRVTSELHNHGIAYYDFGGVDPNPHIATVREGARLCREHNLQLVLAVGGGSVIDCAKGIAFAALYENDPWDFWMGKAEASQALPVGVVLTVAATGSEMNPSAVITNEETEDKRGRGNPALFPKFSILDPTLTFTVPQLQTAAGVADIMAHVYEFYFSSVNTAFLQDSFAEAILKTCIQYGPVACQEPESYEARANLMWAGSMALNGVISKGKIFDGTLHNIEHAVSAIYDLTHGVGLAILTPSWMEYVHDKETERNFVRFAKNVWAVEGKDGFNTARSGIEHVREFLGSLGLPLSFKEVGIGKERFEEIVDKSMSGETLGRFKKLVRSDVFSILNSAQ